jgi:probable HAF family extracellular repeat protein
MRTLAAALVFVLPAAAAVAQPTFRGLGDLPGGGFYSESWGISADGRVPVGASIIGGSGFAPQLGAFAWSTNSGLFQVYTDSAASSHAFAASTDGSVIVGDADYGAFSPLNVQAFVWDHGAAVLIGDLPGGIGGQDIPRSHARAISADGSIVAGIGESSAGTEAFRYDRTTATFTGLGHYPGTQSPSWAYGISGDGSIIVGSTTAPNGNQEAFRWTQQAGLVPLGTLPPAPGVTAYSMAEAVSANGLVIVGETRTVRSGNGGEAFRWTAADGGGGGFEPLGDLDGGAFQSWAYAVNGDGSVIVGRASIDGPCGPFGCASAGRAFIWTRAGGLQDLQQLLTSAGIDLTGWSLTDARGVSADGRTITGDGTDPDGNLEAWIATIGTPPCRVDLDANGAVNIQDFLAFLQLYAAGDARADMDNNGAINIQDFLGFLSAYAAGC